MISIVCGGAGFIGSNIIDRLLCDNHTVVCIDNLSLGSMTNIKSFEANPNFSFERLDLSNTGATIKFFNRFNDQSNNLEVWHMAANSDILAGVNDPDVDIKNTFETTKNILAGMHLIDAKKLYFASSSAVYGDMKGIPASETSAPLLPISNYGAMKLASEALISAAKESFLDVALLYRFPNVVGVPATHGVIYDFVGKLIHNPDLLPVLGDGQQRKSYLHVSDLVDAMFALRDYCKSGIDVFNVGPLDKGVHVKTIAEEVVKQQSPSAHIQYENKKQGWVGDVPIFSYSIDKLLATGWKPKLGSLEAIKKTVVEVIDQEKGNS